MKHHFDFNFRATVTFALLFLALCAALIGLEACGDGRVAGTSSGVDNPQITLAFHDSTGMALRVSGDLNVYSENQNPAVDPQPLWTIKIKNSAFANLSALDISRINDTVAAKIAAAKTQAAAAKVASASTSNLALVDTALTFNLELTTDSHMGFLLFGLNYDPKFKKFTRGNDSTLTHLIVQTQPLVRVEARLSGAAIDSNLSRVFIPGTAFQATLVDSTFTFENLPNGVFPLRLQTADGRIFAVNEDLDTHAPAPAFTTAPTPIGQIDTLPNLNGDSAIQVNAPLNHEAFVNSPSILEGTLLHATTTTPGLSILWKQVRGSNDTATPLAAITSPTSLRTEVLFPAPGAYTFQITVTLGVRTSWDTVTVSVRQAPPPPHPEIIQPKPNEAIPVGLPYKVMWGLPQKGPVNVRFSATGGEKWISLAEHYVSSDSLPIYNWTPAAEFANDTNCVIEVRLDADTLVAARMPGPFHILPK